MNHLLRWLLNAFYIAAIVVFSPLLVWQAFRTGKYREGYREKFLGLVPRREGGGSCIWLHAVSVGEVNLIGTLLRELRVAHPEWQFVVSTTSKTGYDLARKKHADLIVFYCPLDFSWAVRAAMRRIRPVLLVLAELEMWPNLIAAAQAHGARVAIINGRLSDRSFPGYRRIRPVVAGVLRQIDLVAAQDEESAERFRALGAPPERVQVTGSLKYDGAQTDRENPRTRALRELSGIADDDIVFLAGSTQEPEEEIAVSIFRRLALQHPRLRLVLVPRHPERFPAVAKLLDESQLEWQRRTQLENVRHSADGPLGCGNCGEQAPANHPKSRELSDRRRPPVLLVDTVGELGAWWGAAQIAFVGGSFGDRGGQNMIEPAAYGAAVSFGPNTRNFRDIVAALLQAEAAVVVQDEQELGVFVERCLSEPPFAAALGSRAQRLVLSQLGATKRTMQLLELLLATETASFEATRSAA